MRPSPIALAAAAIVSLFILGAFWLSHVYACLTVAFVLAYLLDPVVERLSRHGVPRGWGIPVSLGLFFAALGLAGIAIVPKVIAQGQELVARLPHLSSGITARLSPVSEQYLGYNVFQEFDKFVEGIGGGGAGLVRPFTGIVEGVFTQTFRLVTTVLGLLIIPLMAFYLLRDFPQLYGRFLYVIPQRHHKTASEIRARLDGVLGGFLRGQLVVSTILSVYYGTSFALLGLNLAVVLGVMAGFFNVVPYLGILSVLCLTLLVAVIHGAGVGKCLAIAAVFAVGMGVEGSFLTPRLVGRRVGLRPLTLILALLVGGELKGLAGMLLAVPIAAVSKVFLEVAFERLRASHAFKGAS